MWIWIIIGIIIIYWIFDMVRNGFDAVKYGFENILNEGSFLSKLVLAAIIAAGGFGLLQMITGWGLMGGLAKLSLVAAVVLAVIRIVGLLFRK